MHYYRSRIVLQVAFIFVILVYGQVGHDQHYQWHRDAPVRGSMRRTNELPNGSAVHGPIVMLRNGR